MSTTESSAPPSQPSAIAPAARLLSVSTTPLPSRPSPPAAMTTQEIASSNDPPELCWPWDGQPTVIGFLRDTVLIGTLLAVGRFMFGVTLDTLPKLVEELFGAWRETAASWFDVLPGNDPSAGYPLLSAVGTSCIGILCLLLLGLLFSICTAIVALALGLVVFLPTLFAVFLGLLYLTSVMETRRVVFSNPTPPSSHTQRTLWVTPLIPLTIRLLLALLPVRLDTSSCAVIYTASTGAYLVWWAGRQPGAVKLQYKEAEGKGKNE
ncbi:hypothetical protein RTBOTA2_004733 [Rhodotorula toruloides]|nr:hypothetical protein RTBOTA2_004733 [Rhodotorula toruloides]